ncbi:hypothetical protein FRC11_001110, partial [Ceratobasidium sp. 423]
MGRYVSHYVSKKPQLGAAGLLAALSATHSSLLAPTPSALTTPTHPGIANLPFKNSQRNHSIDSPPPNKQHQVTIEEILEEDIPIQSDQTCLTPPSHNMPCPYKGLYVEEFPVSLVGTPISNECKPPPDLAAYMQQCGLMSDLDHFKMAELLMTSSLSNANKDWHLKSKK